MVKSIFPVTISEELDVPKQERMRKFVWKEKIR